MVRKRPRLIQRRKTVGYTQEKLAEELGVDRTTVVRWERAESEPQPWQRPKLGALLKVSAEELHDILLDVLDLPDRGADAIMGMDAAGHHVVPGPRIATVEWDGAASTHRDADRRTSMIGMRLQQAIADAYDLGELRRVVESRLNVDIEDAWAPSHGKAESIRLLVERAATEGWLRALAAGLRQDTPDRTLRAAAEAFLAGGTESLPVVLVPSLEPNMVYRPDDVEALITTLADVAASDVTKLVAVYGPGGFGKTTLATQVCHDPRVRELFPDILWVETGEQCTPARLVQLISDLCVHLDGTRPALADPEQAGFHLARILGDRRALIVIDNVWSAADLAPFLLGGSACIRLVTTRNVRVCPSQTRLLRLGPMSSTEIRELLSRSVSNLGQHETARLADLCGGWPLLATVVGSNVSQDIAAGAPPARAVSEAGQVLRTHGPHAFDVSDADQRRNAIGQAITSSLQSLEENVSIGGGSALRDRYLSLAIFPAATPIPLAVLSLWWERAYGWTPNAVRQFCRMLADRSLIDTYLADRDAILLHDVFRSYVRHLVGEHWTSLHRSLVDAYRTAAGDRWDNLASEHEYMWRNLSYHMHEAELDLELVQTLANPAFIVTKTTTFGHESLVADRTVIDAVAVQFSADHSAHPTWRVASALTSAGYLLHDLRLSRDIALTLLASFLRTTNEPEVIDQLRHIALEQGEGFDVRWATSDASPAPEDADAGHIGAVTGVAVHGKLVVSCGEDGTVRVWDLASRRQIHSYRGHTGWVFATAISADGEVVASGGDDGMIRLWRRHTGEPVGVLVAHTRRVRSLAFARAGRLLVSGAEDGQVCLWDTERPGLLRVMDTPKCPVWSVSIGCSDTLIAATGEDEFVRLYDMPTGRLLDEKAGHRDWVRSVAFAAAVPLLATGSGDRTVRLWSVGDNSLTPVRAIDVQMARVRCVELSAQADLILAAGEDATLRAFTAEGPAGKRQMPPGVDWVRALAMTPDGEVVAGCEDGALRVWTGPQGDQLGLLASGSNTVWSTAFADDARLALFGRGDGLIEVRDAGSTNLLRTLPAGHGRVWSLASGGAYVAAACGDGTVRVLSVRDDKWSLEFNEGEQRTWAVAVNRAGTRVAASSGGGVVRVWELPSGRMSWERAAHSGRIRSIVFDADGDLLVTGGGEGTVRLWRLSTDTRVGEFANPGGWVRAVAVDDPGTRVAVGAGPGDIYVRDLTEDRFVAHLFGHSGRVLMLGFSADADRLVSAAADGTVRSWSLAEQRQLAEVRVDASLQCGAFNADSRSVIAGSAAGVVAITFHSHRATS